MPSGTVKKWMEDKGFGFITPDDGSGEDVFVHMKALNGAEWLEVGAQVEYEVAWDDRKGKMACSSCTGGSGGGGGGGGGGGYGKSGGGGGKGSSPYGGKGGGKGKGKW